MNGNLLILIELLLVLLLVFGWGFRELRQLSKYRKNTSSSEEEESRKK